MIDILGQLRRMMNVDAGETFNPATDSLEALSAAIAAIAPASAADVLHEQADVAVSINAINAGETDVLSLPAAANTRYIVRNLRLKCANPGGNTVTVRLYELVNDALIEVDTFAIDATNFATYLSLMDMFGLNYLSGDRLQVTIRASGGGPYAVTAQYGYAKTG